jgi:hypothetical protein
MFILRCAIAMGTMKGVRRNKSQIGDLPLVPKRSIL